ncbi:hypothetical protein Ngar_c12180 [Candidatus Nitrososphaera gargensis Ga9.2]|uniref:DUF2795 domain-containing protein n=1 Tax=Nitrososphaera gargensis (strain Ga9.2) TaxID=1237085 RepID=K0IH52_NITGG|nr:hypothetical protein [Candidatus Nitrososphaera gargensis]AFU58158.1 hypothetical protein Ngar_c12180 [Candidatus Nitrososphaera gargensis Ga9.2]
MSTTDRNYTNVEQSGVNARTERVGDTTGEPPTNEAVDRDKASKLANLLEGLAFPATKEKILSHLNQRSPAMGNRINDVLEAARNNLDDGTEYDSAYDVEVAAGLVVERRTGSEKSYVRDRALNKANRRRIGESNRPDPYSGRESITPANSRDVSPNTPRGEDV